MLRSERGRRAGTVVIGALLGTLFVGLIFYFYIQAAREANLREAFQRELELPADAFELSEIGAGLIRLVVRDLLISDEAGDTVLSAARASFTVAADVLEQEGAMVLGDVELTNAFLRLVQLPDGDWNIQRSLRLTVADEPVATPEVGRPIVLADVRIRGGRVLLATPWEPADPAGVAPADVRIARMLGREYQLRSARQVEARLPSVRVGGPAGWRVEVGALSALLTDPQLRIAQLSGTVQQAAEGFGFLVRELRTDRSLVAGSGTLRTVADATVFDVRMTADPIHFSDLRWLSARFPPDGEARLELAVTTRADGRTEWAVRDAEVLSLDSRLRGRLTAITGAGRPMAFRDTDLELDPLDLRVLEAIDLADRIPYQGQLRGTVATVGTIEDLEGPLFVDLVATASPRDLPEVPVSSVAVQGGVVIDDANELQLIDLRVSLRPLHLGALRPLAPERGELLRGTVSGMVLLSGTRSNVRISDGTVAYEIGSAAPTRLTGMTGEVTLEPSLEYDISAIAQPLGLGTLAELVPGFPFAHTTLSGPIQVAGTTAAAEFSLNLRGDVGGFLVSGSIDFTEPARFDVAGQLDALRPAQLLRQDVPMAGPVSGPFEIVGTTRDLRFDVDFVQAAGRFTLGGRLQFPADVAPIITVEGDVADFRVGTLIGRTGLFLSPLTGGIRVEGGGGQAYAFDVDLRGPFAAFDVEGWYDPRTVPVYALSGTVAGLDVRLIPGLESLPSTNLVAAFSLDGRGTSLETAAGRLSADVTGTRIGSLPLQAGVIDAAVERGVLQVATLRLALAGTQLDATGSWGLTQPAADPLRFSLSSANLAALTPVLISMRMVEPQMTGALTLVGSVAGTIEHPVLDVRGSGRNLRLDSWRAASLALEVDARREPAGWAGETTIEATDAVLGGLERFQRLRVEAVGTPGTVALGALVRRDRATEAALSGVLELDGFTPTGIFLQSLSLGIDESIWQLSQPSTIRWGDLTGLEVDGLVLRRTDGEDGVILADGRLPPSGVQGFRLQVINVDAGQVRRLVPNMPVVEGVLTLDATATGPAESPTVSLEGSVTNFGFRGASAELISISARHEGSSTLADLTVWQNQVQVASARGAIPMELAFANLVPQVEFLDAEPISVAVLADSVPAALIAAAIPQVSDGAGMFTGELTVGGTLGSPDVSGWARLENAAVTLPELGVRYVAIEADLGFEGQTVLVRSATARSGGGAAVSGTILLDDLRRPDFNLSISFNQFRAIDRREVAAIAITGETSLAGRYPTPTLSGRVEIANGTIALPPLGDEQAFRIGELDLGEVIGDPLPTAVLEPTFVDLIRIAGAEVIIGDGVWVESPEMRIQIGGELLVSRFGPDEWQVFGDLLARRGTYTLIIGPIVREFDVVSGRLEFFGTPDLNPSLDVLARYRIRSATPGAAGILNIQVQITGTAQFPRLTLTTDTQPPLPESEILSFLIFGRPTFALGQLGEGMASQFLLQEAVGGLLAGQVEQLIRQAGLPFDYIRVRGRPSPTEYASDPLGTTSIEVGWQVAPDLFWTVEWGVGVLFGGTVGDTWGTSLEWQIDPQWSTRLAWEPLRRDPLLQRNLTEELQRQFTLRLRRRWEYGITPPPAEATEPLEPLLSDADTAPPQPLIDGSPPPDQP